MILLAIDTAQAACSAAIARFGEPGSPVTCETEAMTRGHAERLMAVVGTVLDRAGVTYTDIERIAVTVGPGSFTGVRVGLSAARGFGLALGCPVVGVPVLDAIAHAVPAELDRPRPLVVALDARRGQVFARLFDAAGHPQGPPFAADPVELAGRLEGQCDRALAGSGAPAIAAALPGGGTFPLVLPVSVPPISAVAAIGRTVPDDGRPPSPLYLRPPDAKPQAAVVERA